MSLPSQSQAEREREIKFTVSFGAFSTTEGARATVDRIKRYLEVELQRDVKISGRRYG